jgi:multiple sugar transport system substrate-binding protein
MRWISSRRALITAVATGVVFVVTACSGSSGNSQSSATSAANASAPTGAFTLKVAYGVDYVFDTSDFAKKWWAQVGDAWKAKYPKGTIEWLPIPGSYNDIVNKLSLLYKDPANAPDVAEIPSGQIGLWASSNYLLPIDNYLPTTSWWSKIPTVVQTEGQISGKTYAVNHGENATALLYNMNMFKQAGIPLPWAPKTWDDITAAAAKIKATIPGLRRFG